MPNYIFAYHGGTQFESPEQGMKHMQKFAVWETGLGDTSVNPGSPLGMSKTVSADGVTNDGGPNPLAGYSIIKADSMDAALEIAKRCPHLDMDTATIEVAEVTQMSQSC